ncbi:hypothetical protein MKQ70_09015 [Chitinophaga sedimenti]|uniref:hypothetical protein n=1 Tax=Chitinophaga sedimenti TaxID=2033606 RepID=UPI0020035606|nr:hypothetical protein [Chitinophaga sedimenti]MCK7555139.1 hypothetical protein [Chitinophaga sedimenti]
MVRFILRKLFYGLLVLLGVVMVVFFLFNVLPGDPARLTLGQRADVASLENVRRELHLDKPLPVQFLLYLNDLSPLAVHERAEAESALNYVTLFKMGGDRIFVLKTPYLRRSYQGKKMCGRY